MPIRFVVTENVSAPAHEIAAEVMRSRRIKSRKGLKFNAIVARYFPGARPGEHWIGDVINSMIFRDGDVTAADVQTAIGAAKPRTEKTVERIDRAVESLNGAASVSSFFTIEKLFTPNGKPVKPTQFKVVHTASHGGEYKEPGLRVLVVRSKTDGEAAIKDLIRLDVDWSKNQYGARDIYAKAEPILRKYHYREPETPVKKRTLGF